MIKIPLNARALFFIAIMLTGLGTLARAQEAYLDIKPTRAYAFNTALLSCASGFSGDLRLYGVGIDDKRTLLYRSEPNLTRSIEASFHDDGSMGRLELEGVDGYGRKLYASADLPERRIMDPSASILSGLAFSYRPVAFGSPPSEANLEGGDAEMLARQANGRFFLPGRNWIALGILAAWSLSGILLAAYSSRKKTGNGEASGVDDKGSGKDDKDHGFRRHFNRRMATLVGMALMTALAISACFPQKADLFIIVDALPGGNFSLAHRQPESTYHSYVWQAANPAATNNPRLGFDYLAVRSPGGAAVPLSALAAYTSLRFSQPPVVFAGNDGIERLDGTPFLSAWGER